MKNTLEAKIEARNTVNRLHNELAPLLVANFTGLVGKKIKKVNGELMEKFKGLVPQTPDIKQWQIWLHRSDYSLAFTVRVSVSYGDCFCHYDEATIYVGELTDGTLTKMTALQTRRTDYTEKEITDAREEVKRLETALREAQSKVQEFGMYDR